MQGWVVAARSATIRFLLLRFDLGPPICARRGLAECVTQNLSPTISADFLHWTFMATDMREILVHWFSRRQTMHSRLQVGRRNSVGKHPGRGLKFPVEPLMKRMKPNDHRIQIWRRTGL